MGQRYSRILVVIFLFASFAVGLAVRTAIAQGKAAVAETPNKQLLTDAQVERILLLMDTDKNGKISRQEWMNFMAAEFDRLDKDKSGELDPKELTQSRLQVSTFTSVGK